MNVVDLGSRSYLEAWRIQQEYLGKRVRGEIEDTLLFVQHPPTISNGATEKYNRVLVGAEELERRGITLVQSRRGGGTAYFGPNHLVGYTIMEISALGGIQGFLMKVEDAMIAAARHFGADAQRVHTHNPASEKPYRAVWVRTSTGPQVICTKGIGTISVGNRLYAHHGFSFNVAKDTSYFDLIDPCGFPVSEVRPISLEEAIGRKIPIEEVKEVISSNLREVLYAPAQPC